MRKKAGFIVLSMALAGSLMGCSFSLNKDADGSSKKAETTVTEETEKTDETTGMDTGSDTETSEEASSAAGSDGKAAALPEEKKVGAGTGEMPEEYSKNMVVDSKLSGKVSVYDCTASYHIPYIDYDSIACENVNKQVEKLANDYMTKEGEYSTGCIAIGYEWSVYEDLLSLVIRLDFDANEVADFYVYTVDLNKDIQLSKADVIDYLDIDSSTYEREVQDELDGYFTNTYKDVTGTDEFLKETYDRTIAMSNIRDAVPYVNGDGELCVIGKIYSIAGPDYYERQLSVESLDEECEYSGTVYEAAEYDDSSYDTASDDYSLPYSDSTYLTEEDLDGLTKDELRLACNELYARHGRKFKDADYQAYFNSKSWYHGTVDPEDFDDTAVFNQYELANRDFIIEYEKEKGYK